MCVYRWECVGERERERGREREIPISEFFIRNSGWDQTRERVREREGERRREREKERERGKIHLNYRLGHERLT